MYTLGLNAFHADSAAALFQDATLLAASEEERFRRVKHWAGFPSQAIAFCLAEAGISLAEVDCITWGRDPNAKRLEKLLYAIRHPRQALSLTQQAFAIRDQAKGLESYFIDVDPACDPQALRKKIVPVEHHRSHLASAFFASPFDEAALLSVDGSGDFTTTMLAVGQGQSIDVLESIDFPVSLGLFYTAFTQYLGFWNYGDEYKVMGLAPYGKLRFVDEVRAILRLIPHGLIDWDDSYFRLHGAVVSYPNHVPNVARLFSEKFTKALGPARAPEAALEERHRDLAASAQRVTEEALFHLLKRLHERTGLTDLCLAGGVAQNSVANGKILSHTPFRRCYLPPASHDAGIAMGSALYHLHHVLRLPRGAAMRSAFTGSRFSSAEIENLLRARNIAYVRLPDEELVERVVKRLTQKGVIGWFTGRSEYGPRALGGRSILSDPRNPAAKDLLNEKIKRRESFRPFAPSVLSEYAPEYFEKCSETPFMERVLPIRPEKRALIPAVTHVDGSGRLQTVSRETAPRFHALLEKFRERTGIPVLLNTSFNENEPIVNTPAEALDCFQRTQMDMLVLENFLIERGTDA